MKKFLQNFKGLDGSRGFVALFTVLLASVVLAMAIGIANVSLKQIVLSGSATDANKSFYAADSGVECALYNDLRLNSFTNSASTIGCGDNPVAVDYSIPGISAFEIDFDNASGLSCAKVTIDKTDPFGGIKIISKGTNNVCSETNSRTVERVIEVTY